MRAVFAFAFSLAPLVFAPNALAANGSAEPAEEAVRCEIRTTPIPDGVHLAAIATSRIAVTGMFEFEIRKSGGGGTANTAQSGTFSVEAGGTTTLGEVNLGLSGGNSTYTADLMVEWDGGRTSCSASHPERS